MDDTVKITCSGCKAQFRDKARRVVDGYSRQCPSCEVVIFFMEGSPKPQIKAAMKDASQVRRALRAEAEDKICNPGKPFAGSRHSQLADTSD